MINQECLEGREKTMMFYLCQNRHKDDRRKSVTPSVVRHKSQRIIITKNHHYHQKRRNILHQLFLSPTDKLYHHHHKMEETSKHHCFRDEIINASQLKEFSNSQRIELCASILTYSLMFIHRLLLDVYQAFQAHDRAENS